MEAEFVEHKPKSGVYYYKENDTKFTGSFGPDGLPLTGTYVSAATTGIVEVVNKTITSIKNPRADSLRKALTEPQKCNAGLVVVKEEVVLLLLVQVQH